MIAANPVPESFGAAIREAAVASLSRAGHEVRVHDLYADGFDPILSPEAHANHRLPPSTKPDIAHAVERLKWSQWLLFAYPTWWGGQPAILKGWMDRVLVEGVAYHLPEGARRVRPLLRDVTRLSAITTHGSSKLANSIQGEPGKRVILRGVRSLCHPLVRARWVAMYGLDTASDEDRAQFLDEVRTHTSRS